MEGGQNHKIQLIVGHTHPLHMGLAQMVIKAVKVITNIQAWTQLERLNVQLGRLDYIIRKPAHNWALRYKVQSDIDGLRVKTCL